MAERGTYRSIPCALLAGKDFRKLAERQRWVFFVLKMNIGAVGIDTWYPEELSARLCSESGAAPDKVALALDVLEHGGWIEREDNIIWVKGHITHDPHLVPANPKHRKSVQRHLAGLPRIGLVRRFVEAHPEWCPPAEMAVMGMSWVSDGKRAPIRSSRQGMAIKKRNRITNTIPIPNTEDPPASGEAVSWPAEGASWYSDRVAAITPSRFGGQMKPTVDRFGWPDSFAGLKVWEESNRHKARKLDWFTSDSVRWIEMGRMPCVDQETGDLTARGKLALSS